MKNRAQVVLFLAALVVALSTACLGVFPSPDSPARYSMNQGWYDGDVAWWFGGGMITNDVDVARWAGQEAFLAAKLTSALEGANPAARPMYIVLNYSQGFVFSTAPGQDDYSGLWRVYLITFLPGFERGMTSDDPASAGNPNGLPPPEEADTLETDIVVQLPIAALGALDGPWYPAPAGRYRMRQVIAPADYAATKQIGLPAYTVFCDNRITRRTEMLRVSIPDAGDQQLADLLGANLAPGLLNVPEADTQRFWYQNDPKPPFQYPVIEDGPVGWGDRQMNPNLTPIVRYVVLDRTGLPAYVTVTRDWFILNLISSGRLAVVSDDQRLSLLFCVKMQFVPQR